MLFLEGKREYEYSHFEKTSNFSPFLYEHVLYNFSTDSERLFLKKKYCIITKLTRSH